MQDHAMSLLIQIDRWHYWARGNKWMARFAVFNRIALAAGFIPSGLQKVIGERFTALSSLHPMGSYLDGLYHTGFYYTFIGVVQILAAILLLIPRTATLGAFVYFPVILNICILSVAVRFDGSLVSSVLMVFANIYLLCWDYHKWKGILPFKNATKPIPVPTKSERSNAFPWKFFSGVLVVIAFAFLHPFLYDILPHNTRAECEAQCPDSDNPEACRDFCECVHLKGSSLQDCLAEYEK